MFFVRKIFQAISMIIFVVVVTREWTYCAICFHRFRMWETVRTRKRMAKGTDPLYQKKKKINPINRREFFKLSKNIIWKICVASPILLYCYDKIITCASNFTLFLWRGGEDFFDSVLSNIKCQRNWNPSKQQKKMLSKRHRTSNICDFISRATLDNNS